MSGIPKITVTEARGFSAVPANLDKLTVVIGCASTATGLSQFYLSGQSAVAGEGYGDAVDTLCQIIEQKQSSGVGAKIPAAIYTCAGTTAGAIGTVDDSGFSGTATVGFSGAPYGTYEPYAVFVDGGTVGTTGVTLKWSLDGGRNQSQVTALGTSVSFTIPNSGITLDLIDVTELDALINEVATRFNAHVANTEVHTTSDVAHAVAGTASSLSTRLALVNSIRTNFGLHVTTTSGGALGAVHGASDSADAIVAAAATNNATAYALAIELKSKFNTHRVKTTSSIHIASSDTNSVTAAVVLGTAAVGDFVRTTTTAPAPNGSDIDAAFAALASASIDFGLVACEFPITASLAAHVTSGLNALSAVGKLPTCLVRTRIPAAAESDADWNAAIAAELASYNDSRIVACAQYGLITDAMTSRQYKRSLFAESVAEVARVDRSVLPNFPADQPMSGVTLVDSTGATIGHDEGPRGESTGLSNDELGNRFWCVHRFPNFARREEVYSTVPWTLYASDERIRNLPTRRIANAMVRVAVNAGIADLGSGLNYIPADATDPSSRDMLTVASRNALHARIYGALKDEFADDIQNADAASIDTGLVQVSRYITVTGGNLVTVPVVIAPKVKGYLLSLDATLAIQQ